uniref:NADH-ubiquinone oxidoreductase chain 5 n=1 Tax=Utterbackia peninsularis TaxID=872316 RepID=F4ZG75_9BIVA|nr:NADH dehydrogenase subunit 5 [Utterbackia peninsularis]ADL62601.1 NADH dehydrogenase subunit 5 [Utterbackia peninsularis]
MAWVGNLLFSCLCLSLLMLSGLKNSMTFMEWEFFSGWGFSLSVLVLVDMVSVGFSFVVCLISSCVFMYSVSYMKEDKFIGLFSTLVGCFVAAMSVMIYIPHLAFMLLGWDLLGIVSFLLVIFYQNNASVGAGMLTILINRLGDVFLLVTISLISIIGVWGPLSSSVFQGSYMAMIVAGLLVSACMTKSAQMPFSVWLPAAMAAPTPVSALVHSSTLVTAGVYIMFRHYSFFSEMDGVLFLSEKVGCLTFLMASLAACFEIDIKKLIALSTLSHLGFMVYVLGLGYPTLSFFHLLMHALFKSLLFLCVGYYIHAAGSCQDLRHLSGVGWVTSPLLVSCFVIGFSSLCGVPYLSGFYSKDAILEALFESLNGVIETVCIMVSASISYVYSMRILLKAIFSSFGGIPLVLASLEENFISIPLCFLSVSSVMVGFLVQSVWVESCHTFFMSQTMKMVLFLILNIGNFLMLSEFTISYFFWKPKIMTKSYVIIMSLCASMWFLRWLFKLIPEVWYSNMSKSVSVLELGWMEMLGGYWIGLTLKSILVKMWIMERVSLLLVIRFSFVFIFVFYFLLYSKKTKCSLY